MSLASPSSGEAQGSALGSAVAGNDAQPLIRVTGLRKSYGGVHALRGVDFELLHGEVHALLGENGAGKSTMIKVLAGATGHDSGELRVMGQDSAFASPAESRRAGLAVVYQELSLVPSMSVGANLFLGREPHAKIGLVDRRAIHRQSAAFLDDFGFPLNPKSQVGRLPFAYRQMTEIAKALIGDVQALVLDEPTSALTEGEEDVLFEAVRRVTTRGVGVIYVTHRLAEVFRIADRATVFRDGENVGTWSTSEIDMEGVVAAIVGPSKTKRATVELISGDSNAGEDLAAALAQAAPAPAPTARPVLSMRQVSNDRLTRLDLTVHPGEIVGLVGMMGSGRTETLETIFGLRRVRTGEIVLSGKAGAPKDPLEAIRQGIALVPEDRHVQGLVLADTIERNLALPRLSQIAPRGFLRRREGSRRAQGAMQELKIKAPNPKTPVSALSGGNQQKVVFGKWREPSPTLLLLDEPTVGVDVGGRDEIYEVIRRHARHGAGVVVSSSDFVELLLICDRLDIIVDGRIVDSLPRDAVTSEEQLHHLVQTATQERTDDPSQTVGTPGKDS